MYITNDPGSARTTTRPRSPSALELGDAAWISSNREPDGVANVQLSLDTVTISRPVDLDLDDTKVEGTLAPNAKVALIMWSHQDGAMVDVISNRPDPTTVKPGCIGWLRAIPKVRGNQPVVDGVGEPEDWMPITEPTPSPTSLTSC